MKRYRPLSGEHEDWPDGKEEERLQEQAEQFDRLGAYGLAARSAFPRASDDIEILGLGSSTTEALYAGDIHTVGELLQMTAHQIVELEDVDDATLNEIRERLAQRQLYLPED